MRLNEIRCANPECGKDIDKQPKIFGMIKSGIVSIYPSTQIEFISDNETEIQIKCGRCHSFTSLLIK
jgi:hypothetical protein